MKNLDRFVAVMNYGDFDYPPLMGEGPWPETVERWNAEGLPKGMSWSEHLGLKLFDIDGHGFNHELYPMFEEKILSQDDYSKTCQDSYGRRVRWLKNSTSLPQVLENPVKDRRSFEVILERFELHLEERLPSDWAERVKRFNSPDFDALLLPPAGSFFWTLHTLMGLETFSYMFYDAPDLIHRMFGKVCEMCCWFDEKMMNEAKNVVCLGTGEDLAFKNGPFFSPAMFEEFFAPYYRPIVDVARRHGIELFFIDSDGNFEALLPQMLDVGMNIFLPVEVAAGMDPVALRARFGKRLRMIGGVDKRIVARGKKAIAAEMERLWPVMREGGFIPKIDHSIPPDISYDNFRYYMDTLLKMHERCANRGE